MTAPARRRVLPAGPRLEERARDERRERRRSRVRRASFGALAAVPVLLLGWLLLASPLLQVDRVEVTGTARLSQEAVLAAAGVRAGEPLARVDSGGVEARVEALPDVARVRVVRAWPGTLRLQVRERTPLARVQQGDGTWALLDVTGTRFSPSAEPVAGLPELAVPPEQPPVPALQVLDELPAALRGQVQAVRGDTPSTVELVLAGGRSVVWGPPGDATRKAAVVAALLPRPGRVIDVTAPGVAVVREGAASAG